jgi:hypothetical protein
MQPSPDTDLTCAPDMAPWIWPIGNRSRPAQFLFPRGLRQMLGFVISTKTWAHVQLLQRPIHSVTSLPTPARFLLPFSGAESSRFSFSSPFRIQRDRHGGDGGGRAAEGKRIRRRRRLPLQLASPRPVAPQIREFASSSHALQFTSHKGSAGRIVFCSARTWMRSRRTNHLPRSVYRSRGNRIPAYSF